LFFRKSSNIFYSFFLFFFNKNKIKLAVLPINFVFASKLTKEISFDVLALGPQNKVLLQVLLRNVNAGIRKSNLVVQATIPVSDSCLNLATEQISQAIIHLGVIQESKGFMDSTTINILCYMTKQHNLTLENLLLNDLNVIDCTLSKSSLLELHTSTQKNEVQLGLILDHLNKKETKISFLEKIHTFCDSISKYKTSGEVDFWLGSSFIAFGVPFAKSVHDGTFIPLDISEDLCLDIILIIGDFLG